MQGTRATQPPAPPRFHDEADEDEPGDGRHETKVRFGLVEPAPLTSSLAADATSRHSNVQQVNRSCVAKATSALTEDADASP